MINEIKKGFRLIPYGYAIKMNLICGVVIMLLGLAALSMDSRNEIFTASIFIILGPLVSLQVAGSHLYSGLVAASPRRRLVDIVLGDVLSVIASLIGYLVIVGYIFLNKGAIEHPAESMILAGVCMAICVIYFGVALKCYLVGSILYFIGVIGGYLVGSVFLEVTEIEFSLAGGSVVSFLIMVLGVVLSSVLRRLLYKRRLSPTACGTGLKKAMQS